jgi:circadian clock protein KaiC
MNEALKVPARVPTGIPGLDPILEGGLLQGGVYIVLGTPGSGKTIFGNQVCFTHATGGGQAVYITLLAESHTRMLGHLNRMEFFRPELIGERIYYVSAFKVLEAEGLAGLLTSLRKAIESRSASLLVLDGLVSAEEAASSPVEFRKFVHELQIVSSMVGCTVLLLASTDRRSALQPEHTMVDGIIELADDLGRLRSMRHLVVRKLRGSNPVRGRHTVEITQAGMRVRPRFESRAGQPALSPEAPDEDVRRGFGVKELDRMIGGGMPSNSVTMLLGPTGVGKTTLCLQFLVEGVRRGERGLHFGFFERPQMLLRKSERIRLGLERGHEDGLVEIIWRRPVEGTIDVIGQELLDAVRRTGARRLCLDGIQGFEMSVDPSDRVRDVFATLADELAGEGVTTIYTVETPDLFGPRIEVPMRGLSAITHNVILMRHVELEARLCRMISVLKVRDSDHDNRIREFRISESGIEVADSFKDATTVMSGSAGGQRRKAARGRAQKRSKPRRS